MLNGCLENRLDDILCIKLEVTTFFEAEYQSQRRLSENIFDRLRRKRFPETVTQVRKRGIHHTLMEPLIFLQTHVDAFTDKESSLPVIRIYGTCLDGAPVICHITNFEPYFYITCPNLSTLLSSKAFINQLLISFNIQSKIAKIVRIETCMKRSIYGYSHGKKPFLKVFFNTYNGFQNLKTVFENGFTVMNKVLNFSVFESHILYVMRFMIDKAINGMSYVKIEDYETLQGRVSGSKVESPNVIPEKSDHPDQNSIRNNTGQYVSDVGDQEKIQDVKDGLLSSTSGQGGAITRPADLSPTNAAIEPLNDLDIPTDNTRIRQGGEMVKYTNIPVTDGENHTKKSSEHPTDSVRSGYEPMKDKTIIIAAHESRISPCVHEGQLSKLPNLKILSFDIECISLGEGFPDSSKDPVIQIGNTVCYSTDLGKIDQTIFCLRETAAIPNAKVLSFESEFDLLVAWYEYFMGCDPDIVIGYNIKGFDLPYIMQRARSHGLEYFCHLGRRYERTLLNTTKVRDSSTKDIETIHKVQKADFSSSTNGIFESNDSVGLDKRPNSSLSALPKNANGLTNLGTTSNENQDNGTDQDTGTIINKVYASDDQNQASFLEPSTAENQNIGTDREKGVIKTEVTGSNGSNQALFPVFTKASHFHVNPERNPTTTKSSDSVPESGIIKRDINSYNNNPNQNSLNSKPLTNNLKRYSFEHVNTHQTEIVLDGRIVFDMLQVVRKDVNLRSYTLNAVSVALLNSQKEDVPYHAMQGLFEGTPETRRRLASYCLVDTVLPIKLFGHLYVLQNYAEMARVTGVPLLFLSERGQAVRVLSQIIRRARALDFVVPQVQINDQSFEGGFVMDPLRGFYQDPVAVLDFSSLYPSIMIRHNLCYSTMVAKRDLQDLGFCGVKNPYPENSESLKGSPLGDLGKSTNVDTQSQIRTDFIGENPPKHDGSIENSGLEMSHSDNTPSIDLAANSRGSENGSEFRPPGLANTLSASDIHQTFAANCNGSEDASIYGFSGLTKTPSESSLEYHGARMHENPLTQPKNVPSIPKIASDINTQGISEDITASPSGDFFVKPNIRKGLLPQILEDLISERKRTRQVLETTSDPQLRASLDARQLALKIAANSVYGFTGAAQGQLPCLAISQSVTSFGRCMINQTKELIENTYNQHNGFSHNAKVIYGDTDSVMIDFHEKDIFKVFELSRRVSKEVSDTFEKPIKLEFEKVYCPYLLMNKKRYAGLAYKDPGPDFYKKGRKLVSVGESTQKTELCAGHGHKNQIDSESKQNSIVDSYAMNMKIDPPDILINQTDKDLPIGLEKTESRVCDSISDENKSPNRIESTKNPSTTQTNMHLDDREQSGDIGHTYLSISDLKGRIDTKGIETVRRDNCEMVRVAMETCLHLILFKKDIDGAINYVKQTISDLFNNKIDLSQLVITKQLTKPNESYAVKQAHVQLASKLTKRENTKINVGDRISYVIVRGDKNSPAYVRSEDPVFVLQNNLPIDTHYYLQNQLIKPIYRLFEPIIDNVSVLTTGAHTIESRSCVSNKGIAAMLSKKTECIGCRAIGKILCNDCTPFFAKHYLNLQSEFNEQKTVFAKCWTQCQNCQGSVINEVLCVNRDCPIFYKRTRVKKELVDIEEKFSKLSNFEW